MKTEKVQLSTLREVLQHLQISERDAAAILGISTGQLSGILNNQVTPRFTGEKGRWIKNKLEELAGVHIHKLFPSTPFDNLDTRDLPPPDPPLDPAQIMMREEDEYERDKLLSLIMKTLSRYSPREQQVTQLVFFENRRVGYVATQVRVTRQAVWHIRQRVIKKLHRALSPFITVQSK